jgi:hypothetical protein
MNPSPMARHMVVLLGEAGAEKTEAAWRTLRFWAKRTPTPGQI